MDGATYACGECGLRFRDPGTARRCEQWCRVHRSCNLDLLRQAIPAS